MRLLQPGLGSGSGILVGPDLVLTCHHVLQDLFGLQDPASVGAVAVAARIVVSVGLAGRPGEASVTRYLRLAQDGVGLAPGPAWLALPKGGDPGLDYALLRLDDDIGPTADWLSFQEFQSPARLAEGAGAAAAINCFMYHFPDPANGSPYIQPHLSMARLPQDWQGDDGQIAHRVASEKGSSGAMLFASVDGARPFALAVHRGRRDKSPDKIAVAVSTVLQGVTAADIAMFGQLTTPPAEVHRQRELHRLAAPQVVLARNLIDREVQARTTVGGTVAREKKVQPVFESSAAEMALFQARLAAFDLPLRMLADPAQQQTMRCWTLAGLNGAPPVDKSLAKWGIENIGGESWLGEGGFAAVDTILNRAADAQALGASVLLTARVEIEKTADYRALEDLLVALAQALRAPNAVADVLVLLWIGDSGLSDRVRKQGRDVLRRLWGGRALAPVVGTPVELSALSEADLAPWAADIAGAFQVRKPEVDLAIRTVWDGLNQQAGAARHAFEPVMRALDDPLRSWVYLHFRRQHETARPSP